MIEEVEVKPPLTLKERIELLKSNQSGDLTTTTSTSTTNSNSKGIALIGLVGVKEGLSRPSSIKSRKTEGEKLESNSIKSITINESNELVSTPSTLSNENDTPSSIPAFSYPPLKTSTTSIGLKSSSSSSSSNSTSPDLSTLPFKLPSNPRSISTTSSKEIKADESNPVVSDVKVVVQGSSSNLNSSSNTSIRPVPIKPKWLAQSTTPVFIDPLNSQGLPPPKLPPRSNTLSSSNGPALPSRSKPSSSTFTVATPPTTSLTPTRLNRHRAPSEDFESISLSMESTKILVESLSPKLDSISISPIVTSMPSTTSIPRSIPPTIKPRYIPPSSTNSPSSPNSVSSFNITPSKLSTFSTRAPISPLAKRRPIEPRSRIRFRLLFEKLMVENLNRTENSTEKRNRRLDGFIIKWIWEKSKLKKEFLKEVWNECDLDKRGSLNEDEFIQGMWYIDEELRKFNRK